MTATRTWATSERIFRQLRRDPRTVAMLLVVPVALMGLLAWMLPAHDFNQYGPLLLGLFPLLIMFLITSVTTLRERTSGTLERLLTMPMARADVVFGSPSPSAVPRLFKPFLPRDCRSDRSDSTYAARCGWWC